MKTLIFALAMVLTFSVVSAENVTITTTTSATADKVGDIDRPGLLLKFDLPGKLQGAWIDLAYLRFKVEPDSSQPAISLLVRPMTESWTSGSKLSALSDSAAASPFHVNFGRLNLKDGNGKIEITQAVKAWQSGELTNLGLLVYPDEEK